MKKQNPWAVRILCRVRTRRNMARKVRYRPRQAREFLWRKSLGSRGPMAVRRAMLPFAPVAEIATTLVAPITSRTGWWGRILGTLGF